METNKTPLDQIVTITDEELQMYVKYVANAVEKKMPWSHEDVIGILRLIEAVKKARKRISELEESLTNEGTL